MSVARGWDPTPAHFRAVVGSLGLGVVGLVGHRPDVLVLAAPLAAVAVWAVLLRPTAVPTVRGRVSHSTLREGQATRVRVRVEDAEGRVEDVAVVFETSRMVDQPPVVGEVAVSLPDDGDEDLQAVVRATRWGAHRVRPAFVVASSGWNGFRSVSRDWSEARDLVVLPAPAPFDAAAPTVRSPGLVGVNRSTRDGGGTEFASVRPFQPGDRLRRIHWVESLRSGTLHVTSTAADHDRHVILLVDAFEEIGASGGIDGPASSLDITVRAAAAIAEHYISVGDRVALLPLGPGFAQRLPAAAGRRHLRRILGALALLTPATASVVDTGRLPPGLKSGALVIVLSPLLSPGAQQRLVTISDAGFTAVAIDCLPEEIVDTGSARGPARPTDRIARLERETRLRRLGEAGIPVVPWRGPGSIDEVLRGLTHRAGQRMGRR